MSIRTLVSDYQINQELIRCLQYRTLEQKFLYMDDGAKEYYEAGKKQVYTTKPGQGLENKEFTDLFKKNVKTKKKLTLINLGCGNLNRETKIYKSLKDDYDMDFIAVDSSHSMLELAEETLKREKEQALLLHSDFSSSEFRQEITNLTKGTRRVFAFFGSTIANVSQTAIADYLYNLVTKEDLVWFDVPLRTSLNKLDDIKIFNAFSKYLQIPAKMELYCQPLKQLGIPLENGEVTMNTIEEPAVGVLKLAFSFQFAKRTVVEYHGQVLHFSDGDKVLLQTIRLYHAPTLINFFKDHGFTLLGDVTKEKEGLFMFQKQ